MTIAFLIEGFISASGKFREIEATIDLAKANDAKTFDAIESYSAKHSAAVLRTLHR